MADCICPRDSSGEIIRDAFCPKVHSPEYVEPWQDKVVFAPYIPVDGKPLDIRGSLDLLPGDKP